MRRNTHTTHAHTRREKHTDINDSISSISIDQNVRTKGSKDDWILRVCVDEQWHIFHFFYSTVTWKFRPKFRLNDELNVHRMYLFSWCTDLCLSYTHSLSFCQKYTFDFYVKSKLLQLWSSSSAHTGWERKEKEKRGQNRERERVRQNINREKEAHTIHRFDQIINFLLLTKSA